MKFKDIILDFIMENWCDFESFLADYCKDGEIEVDPDEVLNYIKILEDE